MNAARAILGAALLVALMVWVLQKIGPASERDLAPAPPTGGPVRAVASPGIFVGRSGNPQPSAQLVDASVPGGRCVEGAVVDALSGHGIAGARLRLEGEHEIFPGEIETGRDGRFLVRAQTGSIALAEASAEGYFPLEKQQLGSALEMTLAEGTCAAGLVIPLMPQRTLAGRVEDPEGRALAGASIRIDWNGAQRGEVIHSDAEGRFPFAARDGSLLEARLEGYAPGIALVDPRVDVAGQLTLTLTPLPVGQDAGVTLLKGTVKTTAGKPVAGSRIVVTRQTEKGRIEVARLEDASAQFEVPVPAPGPWEVRAIAGARRSRAEETQGRHVELVIEESASLSGRVTAENDRPVSAFSVAINRVTGPLTHIEFLTRSFLDRDGAFTIEDVPVGDVRVSVGAVGHAPSEPIELRLAAGEKARADFKLPPGGTVVGLVADRQSKQPLEGVSVSLEREDLSALAVSGTRTEGMGRFVLPGVQAGRQSLLIAGAGHHARIVVAEVESGRATAMLHVELTPVKEGESPQLELVGIGAVISPEGDVLVLREVLPGGGAAEAGLVAGDAIVSIEGQSVLNLGFGGGIDRLRGNEDTSVLVSVRRADGSLADVWVPRRLVSAH